jgi:hypothetical protein
MAGEDGTEATPLTILPLHNAYTQTLVPLFTTWCYTQ